MSDVRPDFDEMPFVNVEAYGAVHDGATDDTAAVQTAINVIDALGGGTVFFPPGVYAIDGPKKDGES